MRKITISNQKMQQSVNKERQIDRMVALVDRYKVTLAEKSQALDELRADVLAWREVIVVFVVVDVA